MYREWVSMFGDAETPPGEQKVYVLTRTWDKEGPLVWTNGLRSPGCRPWHKVDTAGFYANKTNDQLLCKVEADHIHMAIILKAIVPQQSKGQMNRRTRSRVTEGEGDEKRPIVGEGDHQLPRVGEEDELGSQFTMKKMKLDLSLQRI
ncbi:hypothetical protein LWI28_003423 [Acer negundo]|uniref:Uncharacterized protein n=1 Tax=Acer negundo TaxID=4023 RepID=A0AAD5J7X9_ACENE|nr:hypothetical protein LWI28_003423 [Acer negundo]